MSQTLQAHLIEPQASTNHTDLTGQTFGKWTVKGPAGNGHWNCKCACGTTQQIQSSNLRSGASTKCRQCLAESQVKNLIGMTYGKWTVEGPAGDPGHWNCKCACGIRKTILGTNLRTGRSTQCRKCARLINLTGKTFGSWTVLSHISGEVWKCACKCGIRKEVSGSDLRTGSSTKCTRCAQGARVHDLTGKTFGSWTVLSRAKKKCKGSTAAAWNCLCNCGRTRTIMASTALTTGIATKCRRCWASSRILQLAGKTFGQWTVISRATDGRLNCMARRKSSATWY
jgi:hypothetical protein